MNWFRENPFVAGLAAFTVVAAGALIFLATQAMTQYGEVSDQYTQAVQKLHGLQNRSPFPNAKNLEATKALEGQYRAELTTLQQQLSKLEAPLNPDVKPQQFQDDLRAAVNQAVQKAGEAEVTLPKDFYLGFSQYVNSPPDNRAAPVLARQLTIINELVGALIDTRVQSIDTLIRRQLPEELPANAQNQRKPGIVDRYVIDLAFTADQSKFRVIFNNILKSNRFLIVRAVNIANTSQDGPPKVQENSSQTTSTGVPGLAGAATGTEEGSKELNVILGRELIKVSLRLEMIDFTVPTAEAKN
jgi:hypothetical protein